MATQKEGEGGGGEVHSRLTFGPGFCTAIFKNDHSKVNPSGKKRLKFAKPPVAGYQAVFRT